MFMNYMYIFKYAMHCFLLKVKNIDHSKVKLILIFLLPGILVFFWCSNIFLPLTQWLKHTIVLSNRYVLRVVMACDNWAKFMVLLSAGLSSFGEALAGKSLFYLLKTFHIPRLVTPFFQLLNQQCSIKLSCLLLSLLFLYK